MVRAALHYNNKKKINYCLCAFLVFILLATCTTLWAYESNVSLIRVTGTGLSNVVEYPDKGLSSRVLGQKMQRERKRYSTHMSMEQLHSLADRMTEFYREKGYKFHTVYLPPQKPKGGFIHFKTIEVKLGDIQVIGEGIDKKAIKAIFSHFLNKPLYQPDIDYAVLALKNQMGVDAVAYYSRGSNSGEIRLNIKVQQDVWDAYIQADNYGSEATGEHRLTSSINWYSPTGRFDQLSMGVMAADGDPDVNLFGYLNYRTPLWNLDNQLSFNLSNNLFSIGQDFATLELDGDARIAQVRFEHQLTRTWQSRQNIALIMAYKATDYDSIFKDPTIERDENAQSLALEWNFNNQSAASSFQQQLNFSATAGRYEIDGFTDEIENFSKANVFINLKKYLGSSESRWSNVISLSLRGQYSDAPLPSFEKFLLSGAYGVRSFAPGLFAGERGGFISLDWYFTRLFNFSSIKGVNLTPYLFADYAQGEKLTLVGEVFDSATISGAGVGLELAFGRDISARIFASKEIDQETDSGVLLDSANFFLQINYRIR